MPLGKSEVQFGHAVAQLIHKRSDLVEAYMRGPQMKVSLGTKDLDAVLVRANSRGIPAVVITDAGRTVFNTPTTTCVGLGPMSKPDSNYVTRGTTMR